MKVERYCDVCNKMNETYQEGLTDMFKVKDIEVKATINVLKCKTCHGEVFDKQNEIKNDIIVFDQYKKTKHLMTSADITMIRKKYGLSQAAMAKILGFGVKTITRYENGSIQDSTHDNLLRLIKNEDNFIMLWKLNKHNLSDHENNKIRKKNFTKINASFQYNFNDLSDITYGTINVQGGFVCER